MCDDFDIILIVDDIQLGNGRSGDFFSFEAAGIVPDMVCMSKSIGGGLPLSMVLIKPSLDTWEPAEHTGTFRGNQLALVAGSVLVDYWQDATFMSKLANNVSTVTTALTGLVPQYPHLEHRGRGMIHGLDLQDGSVASDIAQRCFKRGLIIETAGARGQVLKFLAPLTIDADTLGTGLDILEDCTQQVLGDATVRTAGNRG